MSLAAEPDDTLKPSQNPPSRGNSHRSLEEQFLLAKKLEELKLIAENLAVYELMRADFDRGGLTLMQAQMVKAFAHSCI